MPTPVTDFVRAQAGLVPRITWAFTSAGAGDPLALDGHDAIAGCVQFVSSGDAVLQVSNDGVDFYDLTDTRGNPISGGAGMFEFSTSAVFIRPALTSGADFKAVVVLRG